MAQLVNVHCFPQHSTGTSAPPTSTVDSTLNFTSIADEYNPQTTDDNRVIQNKTKKVPYW